MAMLDLKKALARILNTPLVVESGSASTTTGRPFTWTYRKWSDGTAECWGYSSPANYALTAASGYGYYLTENAYFPANLFTSVDVAVCNRKQGSGSSPSNTLVTITANNISPTHIGYYVISTLSNTQSLSVVMYVKGKWK